MITINFLQNNSIPTSNTAGVAKKIVASLGVIACLLIGNPTLARVPEDFMTQPTVLFPVPGPIASDEFVVRGLAYNWAFVDIFIDGAYAGRATTKNTPKGIESFTFKPTAISKGAHLIQALVRSEHEVFRSPLTASITVEIVDPTPAPTLFTFAGSDDFRKPTIRGIGANHTTISIFVDGKLDQEFPVEQAGVPTVTFSVKPTGTLSNGFHTVTARSTASNGVKSKLSNTRTFLVSESPARIVERASGLVETPSTGLSTPRAPTLIAPKTGSVVGTTRPAVTGFSGNDLLIRSFVDGSLDQEFTVRNHSSGTTQFTFLPRNALKSGDHKIYVQAEDTSGNRSSRSNEVNFLVRPEGAIPVFSPSGVSSRVYPPLVTPSQEPLGTTTGAGPVRSGTIIGEATNRNVNVSANTNAPPTNVNQSKTEIETSGINTRKIIGWIILGISVLGIIAYIISAFIERKRNKARAQLEQKAPVAKAGINFTYPASAQPDQVKTPPLQPSQPTQAPPSPEIPDLDDDIPKGYQ